MSPILGGFGAGSSRGFKTGSAEPPGLYTFTNATFTSGGVGGRFGPSLAQAIGGITTDAGATWQNNTSYFNVTATGIMLWTVPATGTYRIETWGARGGNFSSMNYLGGYGSRMRGDFVLTAGDIIKILIGQMGGASYGGGGGGTFVATNANSPLIVSGGGNTLSPWSSTPSHAPVTTSGLPGQNSNNGGTNGGGGGTGPFGTCSGGAGFTGNGASNGYNAAPLSFVNGGTANINGCSNSIGGFGGGSASDGCYYGQSGPGGGYSGGGAGSTSSNFGGAGGSYNIGTNQSNDAGNTGTATLNGNGRCIITKI
nr:MAG: hypothetical protein [Caudoviricetes sp.]